MQDINNLVSIIGETQTFFKNQAQRQVNVALTLRNWFIGFYLVQYEQNGLDRAEYGEKVIDKLSTKLIEKNLKGFSPISLRLYRSFYLTYLQIQQTPSVELYLSEFQDITILRTATAKLIAHEIEIQNTNLSVDPNKLINQLSFSHFIELIKSDSPIKRTFYEIEAIKNSWSVRELERAINSMLFERTSLSIDKKGVLEKHIKKERLQPEDVFRNPFMLEFLGLKEEEQYSESELEQAIINHLQSFLLELGRGFCFEARQKRITFDNTHYHIDLVFYNRLLRCNVLVDLKLGEFTHADAGQMHMYLNYFKDNETNDGDNPPIGIILCAEKNKNLVKYSTAGLPHKVFVNKYMINLPNEIDLCKIIEEEQEKLGLKS